MEARDAPDTHDSVHLAETLAAAARTGRTPAVVAGDLTLVRPLGWHGIPIVAVVADPRDVTLRSRYVSGSCLVPGFLPHHQEASLRVLVELGQRLLRTLSRRVPLIYGTDGQLELLYRHRAALEPYFLFVLNDDTLGWALHDKGRFLRLCQDTGVRVPPTVLPSSSAGSDEAIRALRPPLLVKPRQKSDWKEIQRLLFECKAKARVFAAADELLAHPGFGPLREKLLVQEYIDAPVTSLPSFHGFADREGRLLGWFCGRKLRTFPAVAGESALLELTRDAEVEAFGRDVVAKLEIRGPFKVDLIRDPRTQELYTLEVNARFTLWHHLGAAHGVNLPRLAYDYLVEGRSPGTPPGYEPQLRWVNFYRDVHAFRDDPDLSLGSWLASLAFARTVHEVFAWRDPLPFAAWLARIVRARLGGGQR